MVYLSRIYTRSGDQGLTGLGNGDRVPKNHPLVAAYGEIDELNAVLGVLLLLPDLAERALVRSVQNDLFDVGGDLCVPIEVGEEPGKALRVTQKQVERLEKAIDRINEPLQPLRSFILPGGSPASAYYHLARAVCRRAERAAVPLLQTEPPINPFAFQYLNRLSDLLFVLARSANDGGNGDILWEPGLSR